MLYKILVVMSFMPLLTLGFKRNKPLATKGEVCYGHLGCFPFQRPHSEFMRGLFPWTPKRINTAFLLYTRRNPETFQELIAVKLQTIKDSNFKTSQKTRIIIHGYLNRGTASWLKTMCKAMLQVEDINCICVNWKGGSLTSYDQAAANIRVVGSEVAYFIQSLKANFNYPPSKVHLIGHSLGAHSAGLAGARVPGIGRITGLDPAKPNFQGAPTEVRLDPSDALLVDVIHTDASLFYGLGGYGMIQPVGHLDFYPNGGKKMPGCKKEIKNGGLKVQMSISCSHSRAYKYYTESIGNPNGFLAYPATSFDAFQKGAGFPCRSGGCPLMGHSAEDYSNITSTTQLFYLNTGAKKNFSSWRYKVTVDVAGSNQVIGSFSVSLQVSNRTTKFHEIHKGQINQGRQYTQFIDVEIDAGVISGVMFVWNSDNWTIFWKRLGASSVTVQSGKDGSVYSFCDSKVMKKNVKQTLKPCK